MGSRNGPEGTRDCEGAAFCSLPGAGERDRAAPESEDAFLAMVGRSERSGLENREDSLLAAMMM